MKTMLEKFQKPAVAATHAEAGEWGTARELLPAPYPRTTHSWLERHFAAVAFAESGLRQEAVRISRRMGDARQAGDDMSAGHGLQEIRLSFGCVRVN